MPLLDHIRFEDECRERSSEDADMVETLHQNLIKHVAMGHLRIRSESEMAVQLRHLAAHNEELKRMEEYRIQIQQEQTAQDQQERQRLEAQREASRLAQQAYELKLSQEADLRQIEERNRELEQRLSKSRDRTPPRKPSPSPAPAEPPKPTQPEPSKATSPQDSSKPMSGIEVQHSEYLRIHQNCKRLRQMAKEFKNELPNVAELRREITKTIGQYGIGTKAATENKNLNGKLRNVFTAALANPGPRKIDIRPYLRPELRMILDANDCEAPLLWVYCIHILAKKAIGYFADNCRSATELAEPVGVALANLFCREPLTWKGLSMFDMFIAKFHKVCPVLFGIRGSDGTVQGRHRLGWRTEGGPQNFIDDRDHYDRMTGLGAGFASISLRDFSKVKANVQSPFPHANFWRAVAYIVNTPTAEITSTHYVLLKAILGHCIPRFILFYGKAAKALLREAVIVFPTRSPKGSNDELAIAVNTLKDEFYEKHMIILS